MKKLKTLVWLMVVLAFAVTGVACGEKTPTQTTLKFEEKNITIAAGEEKTLTVTVTGSDEQVEFSSDKPQFVTVEATGKNTAKVTGVAAGTAKIFAKIGQVQDSVTIRVGEASLIAESDGVSVTLGNRDTFKVTFRNIAAGMPTITSSNENKVSATVQDVKEDHVIIEFKAESEAVLGDRVNLTVALGGKEEVVEVVVCSAGIMYGDGIISAQPFVSDSTGLLLLGCNSDFPGGALVIPEYLRFEDTWAPVSHIGTERTLWELPAGVNITSLDTGNSALTIQHHCFRRMNTITKVHIGSSITGIGDNAFDMETIEPGDEPYYTFENNIPVYNGTIDELTFAEDSILNAIGSYAFRGNKLTNLILPDSISIMASRAFERTGTKVLKLPAMWENAYGSGRTLIFFENLNLEVIYLPWECFYSTAGDHYPSAEHGDEIGCNADGKQYICSVFSSMTMCNNSGYKPLTIYYSGSEEYFTNARNFEENCNISLINEWIESNIFKASTVIHFDTSYPNTVEA